MTGEDDLYMLGPSSNPARIGLEKSRPLVSGDLIRDWSMAEPETAIWMYDDSYQLLPLDQLPRTYRFMWPYRAAISRRRRFGTPMLERGLTWYEWQELYADKLRTPLSIAYAEVATHNHFVLDRGGKVFKQTAPVIKLPPDATEDDHLALLGLLNSSTACFWLKQVGHCKGSGGIGGGIASEPWEKFYVINAATAVSFPVPHNAPTHITKLLDSCAQELSMVTVEHVATADELPADGVKASRVTENTLLARMIALQEELDWTCYSHYQLLSENLTFDGDLPLVRSGERAFEILLARRLLRGGTETRWFERHRIKPITDLPGHWPEEYKALVNRRIQAIETVDEIRLIEQPEYKRRWNVEPIEKRQGQAFQSWLSARLEQLQARSSEVVSVATLSRIASTDDAFMRIAEAFRGVRDFDPKVLVSELVTLGAVPILPSNRYKESGIRNRASWEETWDLQRREDRGENVGEIPVSPKYKSSDFKSSVYWSLRGKLDVPKERFISFPGCERESDPSLPILWAGYDHLQQARAIAAYYQDLKENEAAPAAKLARLLAAILELLPWLKQWHNDLDPEFNLRMGDFYEAFLNGELGALGMTMDDLRKVRGL